jgi:hypothetical protein
MVDYMSRDLDNPTSDCVTVTLGDYCSPYDTASVSKPRQTRAGVS